MTIYLVTQGTYSEYSIVGAFSTREAAERYMAARWGDDVTHDQSVEEYEVNALLTGKVTEWEEKRRLGFSLYYGHVAMTAAARRLTGKDWVLDH